MKRFKNSRPVIRALTIFGAAAIVVTGVTYAVLQSQPATLQNNTISSASASLQIGPNANNLGATMSGFSFANIEPGAPASPANDHSFALYNNGTTDLYIRLAIGPGMSWPSNVDISKVWVQLTDPTGNVKKFSLASLYDSYNQGFTDTQLVAAAGTGGQYKIQVLIDSNASSGDTTSNFAIANMNLIFSGTTSDAS